MSPHWVSTQASQCLHAADVDEKNDTNIYVFMAVFVICTGAAVVAMYYLKKYFDVIFKAVSEATLSGASWDAGGGASVVLLILRLLYAPIHTYETFNTNLNAAFKVPFTHANPFRFFTVWNYTLQNVFTILALAASIMAVCGKPLPERLLVSVRPLFEVCLPMSIFVSIIYWGVLDPTHSTIHDIHMVLQHLVNTIYFLAEFSINRMLESAQASTLTVLWGVLFCYFCWAVHWYIFTFTVVTDKTMVWPYFFMSLKDWSAVLWYSGILIALLFFDLVVTCLSHVKAKCMKGTVDGDYKLPLDVLE